MAFPVVEATACTSICSNSCCHTVNLPACIACGDLLLIVFDHNATESCFTFPCGWTSLFNMSAFALNESEGYYRQANGCEGASINVGVCASASANYNAYRISGAILVACQVPEVAEAVSSSNAPCLTPTGGAKDYLWITSNGKSGSENGTPPACFGNELSSRCGGDGQESARRELNAANLNPGSWACDGLNPMTSTIAIHPLAGGCCGGCCGVIYPNVSGWVVIL